MSKTTIDSFLDEIGPVEPVDSTANIVIGSGEAFDDASAGVPSMGAPLINVTLPEEDGVTVSHGRGKLVYYGEGGRKFFGFYSKMDVVANGSTLTFTGTLKEE